MHQSSTFSRPLWLAVLLLLDTLVLGNFVALSSLMLHASSLPAALNPSCYLFLFSDLEIMQLMT